MERLGIRCTSYVALAALLASCNAGFQGGVIPEKFKGAKTIAAISPESIQLSWDGYPGATQYRVYSSESNNAISQPQITAIVFKPNLASAGTTKYAVTAIDPSNGSELGSRSAYMGPVTMMNHFNFKTTGHVTPVEAAGTDGTKLKITWDGYPGVTYRVYLGERSADGLVNYNGFTSSAQTAIGLTSTTVTGLSPGHEYCAVAIAAYPDNTNDGPDATPFTTEVSATLQGWAVGPSGGFGNSKISNSQICARTSSSLSVDNVKIFSQKAFMSTRPVFYVYDGSHPTENDPTATIETSVYQVSNDTGLAAYVGKASGTGQVISLSDLLPGSYKFYAIVTGKSGPSAGSMAKKELIVGNATAEPAEADRPWVYIRGFPDLEVKNTDGTKNATEGYYPNKQQDGYGAQALGSSVAVGDFDCDGKYDIAVGIPEATEISPRDARSAKMGKVVVYYDVDDTKPLGSATPARSQTITFDVTPIDSNARDLRLGTQLFVGNFNNDNQMTNQSNPSGQSAFQCHDLVIGSGYGPMFVIYGKRNIGVADGGLNYSGPTGYAQNPSSSCDTSTNLCSPAVYYFNPLGTKVGRSITSGHFNGSGYEDLVATTLDTSGKPWGTLVFRGSENGLIPPRKMPNMRTFAQGCREDVTYPFPDGPKTGYPYLPSDPNCIYDTSNYTINMNGWGRGDFGSSAGVFPNSYYDLNGALGSHRIRDTLFIGNPTWNDLSTFNPAVAISGRVYACIPTSDAATTPGALTFANSLTTYDMNDYLKWDCGYSSTLGSIMDPPLNGAFIKSGTAALAVNFGSSIQGINNALLYDLGQLSANGNTSETSLNLGFPGTLAIGASGSSNVFLYYGSNFPEGSGNADPSVTTENASNRDSLGKSRNDTLSNMLLGQRPKNNAALAVVAEHPCRISNAAGTIQGALSVNTSYRERCDVQMLTPPSGADWSTYSFAKTMFALQGSNEADGTVGKQAVLAVPAPDRTISSSGSVTYTKLGSIQLFYQNVVSAANGYPIRTKTSDASCDFCRFSDGFANAGSSSIDFDGTKQDNIRFGAGGIASGPLKLGSSSTYNSNADLVVGVPGYVLSHVNTAVTPNTTTSIIDSGAAQVSFSHGGQFRPYQIGTTNGVASPWHFIATSYGQESDIRFHQAISLGDVDQDGLDDIAVRVKLGSQNILRIYKGKAATDRSVGFKTGSTDYVSFSVQGDKTAGMRIIPIGKVSTSQFPVYFITAAGSSYLYFGGVGGLIPGQPSAFASGGAPRKLSTPFNNYLYFGDNAFYHSADNTSETDNGMSFAHGDFNGDGYEDLAIGFTSAQDNLINPGTGLPVTYNGMTKDNTGRVMIFYGGRDNGFQVQADTNGGYPLNTDFFAPYSFSNTVTNAACNATGVCNKVQVLYEGPAVSSAATVVTNYGKSIAAVPAGACNGKPVHSLVVQAGVGLNAAGTVRTKMFVYKPKCVTGTDYTNLSGLVQDGNTNATLSGITSFKAEIDSTNFVTSPFSSNGFGTAMVSVPGIFGNSALSGTDAKSHLVLTDSNKKLLMVYPLTSEHPSTPADNCIYDVNNVATGSCKIDIVDNVAQGYQKIDYNNANIFAGITSFGSSIASVGDMNGDGYADIALSIPTLTKPGTPNTSTGAQGAIMMVFGAEKSRKGLQAANGGTVIEPALNAACYMSTDGAVNTSKCSPTLIFAPQPDATRDGAGERTYLSRDSILNFGAQNEKLGSYIFGVPLRDSREPASSDRILRGGAFYVLP